MRASRSAWARWARLGFVAVAVAVPVNVGAALLDARSGDSRRGAAERDVRRALARRGVDGTVRCASGMSCEVRLASGQVFTGDPRQMQSP